MLVIRDNDVALAVVVRYQQYLAMQNQLEQALELFIRSEPKDWMRVQDASAAG